MPCRRTRYKIESSMNVERRPGVDQSYHGLLSTIMMIRGSRLEERQIPDGTVPFEAVIQDMEIYPRERESQRERFGIGLA